MTRTLSARHVAGWKTKNNNSSTMGAELWRNAGPSAFQLQVSMLKSDKICCSNSNNNGKLRKTARVTWEWQLPLATGGYSWIWPLKP